MLEYKCNNCKDEIKGPFSPTQVRKIEGRDSHFCVECAVKYEAEFTIVFNENTKKLRELYSQYNLI